MDMVGIEIFFTKPFQKNIHFFSISQKEQKANKKVSENEDRLILFIYLCLYMNIYVYVCTFICVSI
jgi:hypothetical protein